MKALLQRVSNAQVEAEGKIVGSIQNGLLVFLCVVKNDSFSDIDYLVKKILALRIFEDTQGTMNCSVTDVQGALLVVSQFTLSASTRKGNRPSFSAAEATDQAKVLYERFIKDLRNSGIPVQEGIFGASMAVSLVNEGPVTIMLDSRES
ncbi:MAG: D-aminoacyl-tRNA deacylase [Nitrospirota bacterium]